MLFSMSMILSVSTVPALEIVHLFTSVSVLFVILISTGAVNLLNPSGAFVSTK